MRYWQPKLLAVGPGEWVMFDRSHRIAVLREVEVGSPRETLIRSVTWAPASADRVLIGYFPHRRMAAEVTWLEYQRASSEHVGRDR